MRPVQRGDSPRDDAGAPIVFKHYREARDPLIGRIGDYCSYCEVCLHGSIHVEHVRPKTPQPALEREWTNFLLGCDKQNDSPELRLWILHTAIGRGHWSVWMQVFQDDVAMRAQLIQWFQGTARDCFDAETRPIRCPGGLL